MPLNDLLLKSRRERDETSGEAADLDHQVKMSLGMLPGIKQCLDRVAVRLQQVRALLRKDPEDGRQQLRREILPPPNERLAFDAHSFE